MRLAARAASPRAIVTIIAKNMIIAKNKGARNIPGALEAPSRHDWQKQSGEGARFAEWNARIAQGAGRYGRRRLTRPPRAQR